MKSDLDHIYKDLLGNSNIEPPEEIWSSISENLDIENVWSNISNDLDYQSVVRFENIGIIASFVVIFAAIYIWSFPPRYNNQDLQVRNQEVSEVIVDQKVSVEDKFISQEETGTEADNAAQFKMDSRNGNVEDSANSSLEKSNEDDVFILYSDTDLTTPESTFLSLYLEERELYSLNTTLPGFKSDWDLRETGEIIHYGERAGKYFLGLTGSIKNTWIINDKTISGFNSQELHATKPIFGREFGIQAGLAINERFSLSGEYHFTSNYAQAYDEYVDGRYGTTNFNIDYNKIHVLIGYRLNREGRNRPVELLFGPYVGILKSAVESFNQDQLDFTDSYKSHIIGITAGFQKPYPLFEKLDLLMGLRASYGLSNIYKGTSVVPASFRITHPAALGLTFGIRYKP